jgi:deferrochelatase/peroxidase EfeB
LRWWLSLAWWACWLDAGSRVRKGGRRVRRRVVLVGAAAVAVGGAGVLAARPAARDAPVPGSGTHQPGVVTSPPDNAVFAAYDVRAADRPGLAALFRRLSDAARVSSAEVTVAVGGSLFDGRYGLAARRPRRLARMPSFPNDVLDGSACHGDVLVQVCGTGPQEPLADPDLSLRWQVESFRLENATAANGRSSTRNLFGFREGVGNPDPRDGEEMDRLVWVSANADEPSWTAGGTYQVVRVIRFATELWDADPVAAQEAVFGRRKTDGAPLGRDREDVDFDYADDTAGQLVALDAHIRLANPRTPETEASRILRRGYSYRRGPDAAGHPDEGLVFVCFQQDLERGFATVQRRLTGQRLDRYILTTGGGYFFVLPGMDAGSYLGQRLIEP